MENKFNQSQFGFRQNHPTTDSVFILKSLINKYFHKNKSKIYICFIDFQKAFDSVWRDGLLYKISQLGIGSKLFKIIKSQLTNTFCSFKHQNMYLYSIYL